MSAKLKYAQKERLIFLDKCITWKGTANRRDLIERFDVSTAQAALDFKAYLERAKSTPLYDPVRRGYFSSPDHQPVFSETINSDWVSIIDDPILFDQLPKLERISNSSIISKLFRALEDKIAINIRYISMTSGDDSQQWIAPTCFASDGERIHVRAFSFKHSEYRDYIPVRISTASSFESRLISLPLETDLDWNTFVRIHLVPRSGLSTAQVRAVKREYGFTGKSLTVETRKALEFYSMRRWGLDLPNARLEHLKTEIISEKRIKSQDEKIL